MMDLPLRWLLRIHKEPRAPEEHRSFPRGKRYNKRSTGAGESAAEAVSSRVCNP